MNKKERLELSDILNEAVSEMGTGFGPSLIGMYLFGPFGIKHSEKDKLLDLHFSKNSIKNLKERSELIEEIYSRTILPKTQNLVDILTGGIASFPDSFVKFENNFKVEPFENIRKIIKENYELQFGIDDITAESLSSNEEMRYKNDYVKFYFDKKHNFLFKFRFKKKKNAIDKYSIRYRALSKSDKNKFGDFIAEVSIDTNEFWKNETLEKYYKLYGKDLVNTMLADYCGFSIIDLNQKRAEKRMSILEKKASIYNYSGFNIVNRRFDDHRKRVDTQRPGGLHLTFVDKGQPNFPIEVQYMGIKSLMYDMFGPNKHSLYTLRGKKANGSTN